MHIENTGSNAKLKSEIPHLRRVLGLWDLIFYGIVLIQSIAAIGLFGIASQSSNCKI